jgi:hypothetical protein
MVWFFGYFCIGIPGIWPWGWFLEILMSLIVKTIGNHESPNKRVAAEGAAL